MAFALMGGISDKKNAPPEAINDKTTAWDVQKTTTNPMTGQAQDPPNPLLTNSPAPPAPAPGMPAPVATGSTFVQPIMPPPAPAPSGPVTVAGTEIGATTGSVTPDMLVESRMANLLKSGNPYIDQAVARARQTANARGMANSTLAGQAGEEAAISAALPIAQQDAGTYFQQQRDNLGYTNQFALADKSMLGQADLQGRDLNNRLTISREGNATQLAAAGMQAQVSRENAQLAYRSDQERIASAERMQGLDLTARQNEAELNRVWTATQNQLGRDAQTALAQMQLSANERLAIAQLQNTSLVNFGNQVSQIFSSSMSAEDKQRYFNNLLGIYTGSPNFPYRPTTGAYTPAPAPPAPPPLPPAPGTAPQPPVFA